LDHRNLLFSEAEQAIYEVNAPAPGGSSEGRVAEEWPPLPRHRRHQPQPLVPLVLEFAGLSVQLHLSACLKVQVEELFGHLRSNAPHTDVQLSIRQEGDIVRFLRAGEPAWECEATQFLPLLKGELTEIAVRFADYEVALHAAAVTRGPDLLILLGSPGAGKTTLAIALAARGFDIVADDVVLLDERGAALGLAFPFATKESSWAWHNPDLPRLAGAATYRRLDGQLVRYIAPPRYASLEPRKISRVVILDRHQGAPAELNQLDRLSTLRTLIAEGDSRDHRLSDIGFAALITALKAAECNRLTYGDARQAAELLLRVHA
jgi:hypothetical protein